MTFLKAIVAAIHPELAGKVFYHGTSVKDKAKGILKDGIIAPELEGKKGKLTPVKGKVYLTSDLSYAVIYALGGSYIGHELPQARLAGGDYGYLFIVRGSDLKNLQPDEDIIGEALHKAIRDKNRNYLWLIELAREKLTPKQWKDCVDGLYAAWAQAGKKLVKLMSDKQKDQLMQEHAHVAHEGTVHPIECWRILKSKSKDLDKDCINFFELAEKVTTID